MVGAPTLPRRAPQTTSLITLPPMPTTPLAAGTKVLLENGFIGTVVQRRHGILININDANPQAPKTMAYSDAPFTRDWAGHYMIMVGIKGQNETHAFYRDHELKAA